MPCDALRDAGISLGDTLLILPAHGLESRLPQPGEFVLAKTDRGVVCRRFEPHLLGYVRLAAANEEHPHIYVRPPCQVVGVVLGNVQAVGRRGNQ